MSVVNVKVANIRPKYSNLKEWMNDSDNIYIGRGGVVFIDGKRFPPSASEFANPYKIGKDGIREEVIEKYKVMIENKIKSNYEFANKIKNLKGKNLGCWCKPESCHGDILLEIANKN
jgi:hypothetical protein